MSTVQVGVPGLHQHRLHERLSYVLLLALLAWSPVPFGSNRPWAEDFFSTLLFGLFTLLFIARIWYPRTRDSMLEFARPVQWLLLAWVLWITSQLIPLPEQLVLWLSPHAWALRMPVLSPGEWLPMSLDRDASLAIGLRVATVAVLILLIFELLSSRRRLLLFSLVLVTCGLLEAMIGLGIYWSGAADVTAHIDSRDSIGPVGTYISRNHFAGFLEMALAMNTGLIVVFYKPEKSGAGWRARVRDGSAQLLSMRGILLTAQLVMFVALILSGSRGGVLALLIAMLLVGGGLALRRRALRIGPWAPVALAAVGAVMWFGGGAFVNRIGSLGLASNRLDLAATSLQIIADYPLTGSGAGTFRWIFPLYKDASFGGLFYEHAHNDYLEIASEQGIVGLVIFLVLTGLLLHRCYRAYCDRHNRLARAVGLGALIAGVSLLGHSMIDFNLQIPANFYWFFAILATGACAGQVQRGGGDNNHASI